MGEFGEDCAQKNKKGFVRSQAACQGILVGVCMELSQFEGFLLAAILASNAQKKLSTSLYGPFSSAPPS